MAVSQTKRIGWIDYSKALAIFLVVLLHVHCTEETSIYISAWRLPMFFILSGYLFSYTKNPSHKKFLGKRSHQILFPYFWISMVAWMAWVLVLRHYGDDAGLNQPWYLPFKGILTGIPPMQIHDIPIWSFMSFFLVEVVFYPLGRTIKSTIIVAAVAFTAGAILNWHIPDAMKYLPLALGPSLTGLGFYALGHLWRRLNDSGMSNKVLFNLPTFIVCLAVFIIAAKANSLVEFYICRFNNYLLFLISSVTGSIVVISLMNVLAKAIGSNRFIRFVSNATLIICGFHLLVFALLKGIALLGFGLQPADIMDGYPNGLIFAVTAFLLTLPIAWVIRKYFRFLVDK